MGDEMIEVIQALAQVSNAKTFDEMGEATERWLGTLQSPFMMALLDQRIKSEKKKESYPDALAETLRLRRFLHNALARGVAYAVAEEYRLQRASFSALYEMFGATPAMIQQIIMPYQALLINPEGIAWARMVDRANSRSELDESMEEHLRQARHERRTLIIQFLDDTYHHDVKYAQKRFKQGFEAWLNRVNDALRGG